MSILTSHPHRSSGWSLLKTHLGRWRRRAHSRHELMNLSDRTLRDIGVAPRRIREEIVVNRQPSKSAALPFPHRSHSSRGRAPEWQGTYLSNV